MKSIIKHLFVAFILFLVLLFGAKFALSVGTRHGDLLEVPDFRGMTFEQAQVLADEIGVRLEIVDSIYSRAGRGTIREHNPSAGSKVKDGRRVLLTVNAKGVKKVTVPNLIGYSTRQAAAELSTKGLNLGRLVYVEDIATNNVLKQKYRGRDIDPGSQVGAESSIDLVVGLADEDQTLIPDLTGKSGREAVKILHDHYLNAKGLRYDKDVRTYEDSLHAVVYKQTPAASELPVIMGSDVTLYLRVESSEE